MSRPVPPDPDAQAQRLEEAIATSRELIAEMHGVTKDLRAEIRHAREVFPELSEEAVLSKVDTAVNREIRALANEINQHRKQIYETLSEDLTGYRNEVDRAREMIKQRGLGELGPNSLPSEGMMVTNLSPGDVLNFLASLAEDEQAGRPPRAH